MSVVIQAQEENIKNILTSEQVFNFVKKSATEKFEDPDTWKDATQYYLEQFARYGHKRIFMSWNWASALGLNWWVTYRKMYLLCSWLFIAVISPSVALSYCKEFYLNSPKYAHFLELIPIFDLYLSLIILFFSFIFFGLFGNMLYFKHIYKSIQKNNYTRTGVSNKAMWVVIVLEIILVYLLDN